MEEEFEIGEILGFIESKKKYKDPTSDEWGVYYLEVPDILTLLMKLGFKITRKTQPQKERRR